MTRTLSSRAVGGVVGLLGEARAILERHMYGTVRVLTEARASGETDVELHALVPTSIPGGPPLHLILSVFAVSSEGDSPHHPTLLGIQVTRGMHCASALEFAVKAAALLRSLSAYAEHGAAAGFVQ